MSVVCTNPQHPAGMSREMIFLQEKDRAFVFGCQACRDVNHKLSIRVMTDPRFKREVRADLARQGKLPTERPKPVYPRMQSAPKPEFQWDETKRRSSDGRYELVSYKELKNGNLQIQMAVDGKLAPMMDDHLASREEFKTDEQYFGRVARSSELMLHLFGDPRNPLSPEESERRQHETF